MKKQLIEDGENYIIKFTKDEIKNEWIDNEMINVIIDNLNSTKPDLSVLTEYNNKIKIVQRYFSRMSKTAAIKLYNLLIKYKPGDEINLFDISDNNIALYQFNASKFNKDENLKQQYIEILRRDMLKIE